MTPVLDPDTSLWHVIALEVQRQRIAHDLSVTQLATRLRVDRSTVSRIEHGWRKLSPEQADGLDAMWDLQHLFRRLVRFAAATDDGNWFTGLMDFEKEASLHRMWEALLVPGLLQTPDYARAMISTKSADVEAGLETRLARQASVFDGERAPRVSVILNWAAIEQCVGGRDVMRGQLAHLLEMGERPNVNIRVMERDAGAHVGLDGSFRLLTISDREIAYSASPERGRLVLEASDVHDYAVRYDLISNLASPVGASRRLIEQALEA
ncbi:helix-turn-helix domain-containing protein [Actinomadura litoris]|uniref:helix-turn-helix domain-containing protein n=1 Tax=Actinomadura litoris TaxID=2678616 RepID=UPI001FA78E31|nr:Scr1 family TA system antitoxin-like transcriptional regulator [Actinomadura litoris]